MRSALVCLLASGCLSTPSFQPGSSDAPPGDAGTDVPDVDARACVSMPEPLFAALFDEGTGTTTQAQAATGTLTGDATWRAMGHRGSAIAFEGDGYVDFGAVSTLGNVTPLTVCAWVRPRTDPGEEMNLVDKSDTGITGGWKLYLQDVEGAGHLAMLARTGSYRWGTSSITPLAWTHLCGVWSGSSTDAAITLYVNGSNDGRRYGDTPGGGPYDDSMRPLRIGGGHRANGVGLVGALDDLMIFRGALTAAEVAAVRDCTQD